MQQLPREVCSPDPSPSPSPSPNQVQEMLLEVYSRTWRSSKKRADYRCQLSDLAQGSIQKEVELVESKGVDKQKFATACGPALQPRTE